MSSAVDSGTSRQILTRHIFRGIWKNATHPGLPGLVQSVPTGGIGPRPKAYESFALPLSYVGAKRGLSGYNPPTTTSTSSFIPPAADDRPKAGGNRESGTPVRRPHGFPWHSISSTASMKRNNRPFSRTVALSLSSRDPARAIPAFLRSHCPRHPESRRLAQRTVTFTNKAAREMRERIDDLLGGSGATSGLWMGTFHSMGVRILRSPRRGNSPIVGIMPNFAIYDDADQIEYGQAGDYRRRSGSEKDCSAPHALPHLGEPRARCRPRPTSAQPR